MAQVKCKKFGVEKKTAKIEAHKSWLEHPQIKVLVEQLESLSDMASHYFLSTYSGNLKRVKKAPAY